MGKGINSEPIKWIVLEQRGNSRDYPLMPAVLALYRITTSNSLTRATSVRCGSFLLDRSSDVLKNYVKEDEWNRFCGQCYKKAKDNPDFQEKLAEEFLKRVPNFLGFCRKVYKLKNG